MTPHHHGGILTIRRCNHCGYDFVIEDYRVRAGGGIYCDKACAGAALGKAHAVLMRKIKFEKQRVAMVGA